MRANYRVDRSEWLSLIAMANTKHYKRQKKQWRIQNIKNDKNEKKWQTQTRQIRMENIYLKMQPPVHQYHNGGQYPGHRDNGVGGAGLRWFSTWKQSPPKYLYNKYYDLIIIIEAQGRGRTWRIRNVSKWTLWWPWGLPKVIFKNMRYKKYRGEKAKQMKRRLKYF